MTEPVPLESLTHRVVKGSAPDSPAVTSHGTWHIPAAAANAGPGKTSSLVNSHFPVLSLSS